MDFTLPGFAHVKYRLWRLRRLIVFCTLFPAVALAGMGALGWIGMATGQGLVVLIALAFIIVATHAVVFPGAHSETMAVSLLLTVFVLFAGGFGGSVLAWLIFVPLAAWIMLSVPGRVLNWQGSTAPGRSKTRAQVRTRADLDAARRFFPLRPDHVRGQFRCGPAEADGAFPVWYDMPVTDIFEGIDMPEPNPENFESMEEYRAEMGIDPDDPDFGVVVEPAGEPGPTFWAMIEAEEPDYQRTRTFEKAADGTEVPLAVEEIWFKKTRNGCHVTEVEAPANYPWGMSFTMWLNDFHLDGMVQIRDLLEGRESPAMRPQSGWTLTMLLARRMMVRQVRRLSET